MEVLLIATMGLFGFSNAEFFQTAEEQQAQGYEWHYVGKNAPSGTPALVIKPHGDGDEFILWRLEK